MKSDDVDLAEAADGALLAVASRVGFEVANSWAPEEAREPGHFARAFAFGFQRQAWSAV